MGYGLRHTVVQILHVAGGHQVGLLKFWGLDEDFKVDVVGAEVTVLQVWEHAWILLWQGTLEGGQGFWSNDPWTDGGGEVLGVEGTQRDVLPNLQVSGTPIIEKAVAKDVVAGIFDCDWISKFVWSSNESSHFEFQVKSHAL